MGVTEAEYYTLTDEGITVRTDPAGAWKDETYNGNSEVLKCKPGKKNTVAGEA